MEEFQSPEGGAPSGPAGELDLGLAVSEGVSALLRNLIPVIGVSLIGGVAYFISICTCIGWIVVVPILLWGLYAFVVQMVDGEASVSTLFSGLEDFGRTFLSMWGLTLLMMLVYLPPGIGIGAFLFGDIMAAVEGGGDPDPIRTTLITAIPMFLWSLLAVRFMLAPFLIVDGGRGVIDAFSETWARTGGGSWGKLIVLQILLTLLNAPAQVLSAGGQVLQQGIDPMDTQAQLDALPVQLALNFGVIAISAAAGVLGLAMFASAYRQLVPATGEEEVP